MKIFVSLISMAGALFGDTAEKSFYLGDQRFSIKVSGDQLENMLGMDPRDPATINLSISKVADLADGKINTFKEDNEIEDLSLEKISVFRFHVFDDGKELWLWEASYRCGKNTNGPVERVSVFITKNGEILMPQLREYSNTKEK
jgi:hypothetical protein